MRKLVRLIVIISFVGLIFKYNNEIKENLVYLNENFLKKTNISPEITIKNLKNINENRVIVKVNSELKKNQIILDLKQLEKKIKEIKEIKSLKIKRDFYGNLKITIVEKKPFMIWRHEKKDTLIDINGESLYFDNINKLKLPILIGEDANKNVKKIFKRIEGFKTIKQNLISIEFVNKYRWNLMLNGGIEIMLSYDNVNENLYVLNNLITNNFFQKKKYKIADFRVKKRIFFK